MAPCQHIQDGTCSSEFCSNDQTYPFDLELGSQSSAVGMGNTLPSGVFAPLSQHHSHMPPVHDSAGASLIPSQHGNVPSSAVAVDQSFGHQAMGGMGSGWQTFPHVHPMPGPHMGYASQQQPAGQPAPAGPFPGHGANGAPMSPPPDSSDGFFMGVVDFSILSAMSISNVGGPGGYWTPQTASSPFQGTSESGKHGLRGSGPERTRFQCNRCPISTTERCSLKRHQQKQHGDPFWVYVIDDQRPTGEPSAVVLDKPLGECHECREGKPYGQGDGAKAHLVSVHSARLARGGGDGAVTMTIDMFRHLIRRRWMSRAVYVEVLERIQRTSR